MTPEQSIVAFMLGFGGGYVISLMVPWEWPTWLRWSIMVPALVAWVVFIVFVIVPTLGQ